MRAGRALSRPDAGRRVAPVAGIVSARHRVMGIAGRSPRHISSVQGAGKTGTKTGGDPRREARPTPRESVAAPERVARTKLPRQGDDRRVESCEVPAARHLVKRRAPVRHRPIPDAALERRAHPNSAGDSDHAFGWSCTKAARPWRSCRCNGIAAE